MEKIIIMAIIGLIAFTVKVIIDLYASIVAIRKDKSVLQIQNNKEKEYEFIKGLH